MVTDHSRNGNEAKDIAGVSSSLSKCNKPSSLGLRNHAACRSQLYCVAYIVVIVVALFERVSLTLVNREANDNHFEVIQLLSENIRELSMEDCRECFHPKLYYLVCVRVLDGLGTENIDSNILISQSLNCISGFLTLIVVWLGLRAQNPERLCLFLTFAWVATNPRLIAINSQVSNDSFCILFGTIAIYFTARMLRSDRIGDYVFAQVALGCAILTKGTSWPASLAILILLSSKAVFRLEVRIRYLIYAGICTAMIAASISFGGYDFENYDKYANLGKGEPLFFFDRTVVGRPGVISIWDSYFTFRYVDLLKNPINLREQELEPFHRSSVWTQLYGRLHSVQFDFHPKSWRTQSDIAKNTNRVIFVLSISWLVVSMVGLASCLLDFANRVRLQRVHFLGDGERYIHLLVVIGYLSFIVFFTFSYRDFAAMNVIYIFPGILSFAIILQEGIRVVLDRLFRFSKHCGWGFVFVFLLLCIMYVQGLELLVEQLSVVSGEGI